MADDRDSLIREQAYRLWQQAGEPHGQDRDHWEEAERTLGSERPAPDASPPAPSTPAIPAGDDAGTAAPVTATDDSETPAAPAPASAPAAKPAKKPATRRKRPG